MIARTHALSMDKTRLVVVDSAYCDERTPTNGAQGANYGEYVFTLRKPVYGVRHMELVGVSVPNTILPIRFGVNDTINFWYNVTAYSASVAPGTYASGAAFATELASVMNTAASAGTDISVLYDTSTGVLVISSVTNQTNLAAQTTTPAFADVIGWVPNDGATSGGGTGSGSENTGVLNLGGYQYLLLEIIGATNDTGFETVVDGFGLYSYVVPMDSANFLEVQTYRKNASFTQLHSMKRSSLVKIRVKWTGPGHEAVDFRGAPHTIYLRTSP